MSKYGWKSSLAKGKAGEEMLLQLWPELIKMDNKAADFLLPDGTAVELKSDSYNMIDTANYFIERYSDIDAGKPGGPWQSWGRGCKYFVYMYTQNKTAFVFHTTELMKAVEAMEATGKLKPVSIRNARHTTVGYKVPRQALEHLLIKVLK